MEETLLQRRIKKIGKNIVASCWHCSVSFTSEIQLNQHLLYHQSPEFYNFWLSKCTNLEKENLQPILISEPSEYNKYRPSNENSIPKISRELSLWDYTWEDWDAMFGEKPVEELEILPSCRICEKEFLHENTLIIHQSRNCLKRKKAEKKGKTT